MLPTAENLKPKPETLNDNHGLSISLLLRTCRRHCILEAFADCFFARFLRAPGLGISLGLSLNPDGYDNVTR